MTCGVAGHTACRVVWQVTLHDMWRGRSYCMTRGVAGYTCMTRGVPQGRGSDSSSEIKTCYLTGRYCMIREWQRTA